MKKQRYQITLTVAVWVLAASWVTGCLVTDEPEYQSTFELNAGDLYLSEFDLSMEGLDHSTDITMPGGQFEPNHDYCTDYCDCRSELFYDYYGYWVDVGDCLDDLDTRGFGNEDCYNAWMVDCSDVDNDYDSSGYNN